MSIDYELFVIRSNNRDTTESQLRDCIADAIENLELRIEKLEKNEPKPKTKRYRLIKDLPTFKAGDIFEIREDDCLWFHNQKNDEPHHYKEWIMAYHQKTLERFPNILTDWFEEEK